LGVVNNLVMVGARARGVEVFSAGRKQSLAKLK
jgi:hypothetical protein